MNDKIIVIGESCKDIFHYCDANRLCPDIPVPVLTLKNVVTNPGMAMNTWRNLKPYIKHCNIITNSDWENITKTRYIDDKTNHMFFRIDSSNTSQKFDFDGSLSTIEKYNFIVISDYNKGFLTENDIYKISNLNIPSFLDTKKIINNWAINVDFIKINNYEYNNSKFFIENRADILKKVIHTDGGNGCFLNKKHYKTKKIEIKDSSGAGDSFFAGFIIKFLETDNIEKSIRFANKCASKVVSERGVTTI